MHRAGIIRHANLGPLNKRSQFCGGCFTGKITRTRCGGSDFPASRLVAFSTRHSDGKTVVKKLARDGCKSFNDRATAVR